MMRSQSSVPREILNLVWEHCANDDARTMQANCKPRLFRVGIIDISCVLEKTLKGGKVYGKEIHKRICYESET